MKREDFIRSLMSKAGNLMLFLQHVQRVELHRLSEGSADPSQTELLMTLTKETDIQMSGLEIQPWPSVVDHFTRNWQKLLEEEKTALDKSVVLETVSLSMRSAGQSVKSKTKFSHGKEVEISETETDTCHFRVAWTTGQEETHDIALKNRKEGFLPLAAVAVPWDGEGRAISIKRCPEGKLCVL